MTSWIKQNIIIIEYLVMATILECLAMLCTGSSAILTQPLYPLTLLAVVSITGFLLKNSIAKTIYATMMILAQMALLIGFIFLFDSNGTTFEWSMLYMLECLSIIPVQYTFNIPIILVGTLFITLLIMTQSFVHKDQQACSLTTHRGLRVLFGIMLPLAMLASIGLPVINTVSANATSYTERLYNTSSNAYQTCGVSSAVIYELLSGSFASTLDTPLPEDFAANMFGDDDILATSDYHGVSQGNNLIMILVESFDWHVLEKYSPEIQAQLYPNLTRLMNDGIVADNFYAKEKTDSSENLMTIGSNPTNRYANYSFADNSYPHSLPNMLSRSVVDNGNTMKQPASFHSSSGIFYNRNNLHMGIGFDKLYDIVEMEKHGVTNSSTYGEISLDSDSASHMKDVMIPAVADNEQYFSFWITYTMHGFYEERANLKAQGYYDRLDELGVYPSGVSMLDDCLRTYAATVLDFDAAMGVLLSSLEDKGQLEDTTVLLISDHNSYYNNMSALAKGIDNAYDPKVYRVPTIIYDQKLKAAMTAKGEEGTISKFTTTGDIIPTVLDMFGIKGWSSLYYGSSMLISNVESIIYSRAYGQFMTDKIFCYSILYPLYTAEGFNEADLKDFETRALKHLIKTENLDKIYFTDYFSTHQYRSP